MVSKGLKKLLFKSLKPFPYLRYLTCLLQGAGKAGKVADQCLESSRQFKMANAMFINGERDNSAFWVTAIHCLALRFQLDMSHAFEKQEAASNCIINMMQQTLFQSNEKNLNFFVFEIYVKF